MLLVQTIHGALLAVRANGQQTAQNVGEIFHRKLNAVRESCLYLPVYAAVGPLQPDEGQSDTKGDEGQPVGWQWVKIVRKQFEI